VVASHNLHLRPLLAVAVAVAVAHPVTVAHPVAVVFTKSLS
jgi:hypothetical protein